MRRNEVGMAQKAIRFGLRREIEGRMRAKVRMKMKGRGQRERVGRWRGGEMMRTVCISFRAELLKKEGLVANLVFCRQFDKLVVDESHTTPERKCNDYIEQSK